MKRVFEILIAGVFGLSLMGGSCDEKTPSTADTARSSSSAAPHDPWLEEIKRLRLEYEQNDVKLRLDWKAAMAEAQSNDLNADRLTNQIVDLGRELQDNQSRIEAWDAKVTEELQRRKNAGQAQK